MFLMGANLNVKQINIAGILAYLWCDISSKGKRHLICEKDF